MSHPSPLPPLLPASSFPFDRSEQIAAVHFGSFSKPSSSSYETLPSVTFSADENKDFCSPWNESVIISLKGLFIDQSSLASKINSLWKLKSPPKLLNLGLGFFLVAFACLEDRWKAILGGPYAIDGHFLSLQLWKPKFDVRVAASEIISPVWIRIDNLPVEFYNHKALSSIGNSLGSFKGIGPSTFNLTCMSFAKICVIMDLSFPLSDSVVVDGISLPISFEGNIGFCSNCGAINHSVSTCPSMSSPPRATSASHDPPSAAAWVTVRKKGRGKAKVPSFSVDLPNKAGFSKDSNLKSLSPAGQGPVKQLQVFGPVPPGPSPTISPSRALQNPSPSGQPDDVTPEHLTAELSLVRQPPFASTRKDLSVLSNFGASSSAKNISLSPLGPAADLLSPLRDSSFPLSAPIASVPSVPQNLKINMETIKESLLLSSSKSLSLPVTPFLNISETSSPKLIPDSNNQHPSSLPPLSRDLFADHYGSPIFASDHQSSSKTPNPTGVSVQGDHAQGTFSGL